MPPPAPLTAVGGAPSTPSCEKGWSSAGIQEYLEKFRSSHQLPIYPYQPDIHEAVMCSLVLPHLEEVFDNYRLHGGRFSFYPHALLIRDWSPTTSTDQSSWWRKF